MQSMSNSVTAFVVELSFWLWYLYQYLSVYPPIYLSVCVYSYIYIILCILGGEINSFCLFHFVSSSSSSSFCYILLLWRCHLLDFLSRKMFSPDFHWQRSEVVLPGVKFSAYKGSSAQVSWFCCYAHWHSFVCCSMVMWCCDALNDNYRHFF